MAEMEVLGQSKDVKVDPEAKAETGKPPENAVPPVPEKMQIIIELSRGPLGFEVSGIGGKFPANDIIIRGALDQAKEMISFRLAQRRAIEEAKKPKIVVPGMVNSLKMAGNKVKGIFR